MIVKKTPAKEQRTPDKEPSPVRLNSSINKKTPKSSPGARTVSKPGSSLDKKTPRKPRVSSDFTAGVEEESTLFVTPVPSVNEQLPTVNRPVRSTRKSIGLEGLSRLMKTPEVNEQLSTVKRPVRSTRKSVGLEGLSRLMKTPKVKSSPLKDLQGISELFASPVGEKSVTTRAKARKSGGNWLKTLATAAHGKRKKNVQDEVSPLGLSELFASPLDEKMIKTRAKTAKPCGNWLNTLATAAHGKRSKYR